MAGSTLKKGTCLQDGWLHIEGRGFTGVLHITVYWMAGSTLKDGWLQIEGRGRFTG